MLVWRNSLYDDYGHHLGYIWFGAPEDAENHAKNNSSKYKDRRARVAQCFDTGHDKKDMLLFLNHVAEHGDNG